MRLADYQARSEPKLKLTLMTEIDFSLEIFFIGWKIVPIAPVDMQGAVTLFRFSIKR
jgi:hypothetical protein